MWGRVRSSRGPAEVGPTVRARRPPLLGDLVHVALCSCASILCRAHRFSDLHCPRSIRKYLCSRTSVGGLDKSRLSLGGSS